MQTPRISSRHFAVLAIACSSLLATACGSSSSGGGGTTITLGSGSVSWSLPALREDGTTPLNPTDITGYRILFGPASEQYDDELFVDTSSTNINLDGIPVGDYFAVVTTVDDEGRESLFSNEVTMTVR